MKQFVIVPRNDREAVRLVIDAFRVEGKERRMSWWKVYGERAVILIEEVRNDESFMGAGI